MTGVSHDSKAPSGFQSGAPRALHEGSQGQLFGPQAAAVDTEGSCVSSGLQQQGLVSGRDTQSLRFTANLPSDLVLHAPRASHK